MTENREAFLQFPAWKKGLLGIAIAAMAVGGALSLVGGSEGEKKKSSPGVAQAPTPTESEDPTNAGDAAADPDGSGSARTSAADRLGIGSGLVPLDDPPKTGGGDATPRDSGDTPTTAPPTVVGEDEEESADDEAEEDGGAGSWAPFFLKGGFGFFVGFCLGHFLRTFLKLSAFFAGFLLLVIFGLQYSGVIDVDWDTISNGYDKVVDVLATETRQFWSFIQGSLPSAAAGSGGLFVGFRRS